ncbi:MAG: thiamine pyrophosphate-dependent dehydrogenase E1 component subunit alpha [Longimicrobiales bacterium]|nr:thiamine pyrophosphate-dependent dehydrogenase E1 component subunit alpha [Longimicrobiales bacterium]
MRRYPAWDPPEYLEWSCPPEELEGYRSRLRADPARSAHIATLAGDDLLSLHEHLLRTRLHDIALKRWVRTGVISKAWLGTGEEAVTVGAVAALDTASDVVIPMIRNAGALPMMGMPLVEIFRGYLAAPDSPSGGRDLHLGDLERGVLQPVSQMGTNVPIAAGLALAFRQRGEGRVALTWVGDGATRCAACHEGLVTATRLGVPAVFVLQNNQVALGTPIERHGAGSLRAWASAYGIEGLEADGNNVLDVWAATRMAVERCRAGRGPVIVYVETFRMGGHATHDEREARDTFDPALFEAWGRRDPIGLYERYLIGAGFRESALDDIEARVSTEVDGAADDALRSFRESKQPFHVE